MRVRVNFRFPNGDELRYLERAPRPGSVIQHRGAHWVVTDVDLDTAGGYTVGLHRKRNVSRQKRRTPH